MTKGDPIIGIQIARSDVAFIHDVLMGSHFSGAQMLQAAGIIAGLRPALAATKHEDKPEDKKAEAPAPAPKAKRKRKGL